MLELKDFFHLPQVDALVEQLVAEKSGLIVVAGLDPRPLATSSTHDSFLPSGRSTIFRILMRQILAAHRPARAIVVCEDKNAVRIPRQLRRQIQRSLVEPPLTYAACIADATRRRPGLLVVDRLCAETTPAALEAAQKGLRVLSQLDTVFRGADVARHLLDLGASQALLGGLAWIVAVGRLAMLCPHCKQPAPPDPARLEDLNCRYPALEDSLQTSTFFRAVGCPRCQHSGRAGNVAVFDIFRADTGDPLEGTSLLPLDAYVLGLAALGHLPLDDVFRLDADQLRHTYNLLTSSERALSEINAELQRRLAEIEAANRVLQARTEALISLQDIGQALTASTSLNDLAVRVCRHAHEICCAERAILYLARPGDATGGPAIAEVLAVSGWDPALVHQRLDANLVFGDGASAEPTPCADWPPGIPPRHSDVEGVVLRAGLRVPLVAQGVRVGLMIVHTTAASGFTPGEVALLRTFANQAAVAIQRAGLIEQLQEKIVQLEAAQAELVKKERLEREMELARQVQQSVLPRTFPLMPGYTFGARNEPARRVGGDFYDVILLDGDRFGVVMADVSDKGMPAALYMALTRSLILAEARRETSPRAVLSNVHRLLLELGEPDMFVTVFYGVVEGPARRLTYARAGHDRPLLLRENTVQLLGGEGTLIGIPDLHDLGLSEERLDLAPSDRLVLYTDGLTDLLSPDDRLFGLGRLQSTLQSHAALPPPELCAAVFADLAAYQGSAEQYDDMTMLVVDVK
jgi:sigma-B regulation protein RsbU (phosphoserine phosphatase)